MSISLHTSHGVIKVEIFCDKVPRTSENFLALAASGFYDNTVFHRNMKGFMLQGGDPSGGGKGGECIWGGVFEDEFRDELRHDKRGMLSMANNAPDTNGSQFFIIYSAQPHLNDKHTVFGQVIDGFDVLDAMERVPVGKKFRPEKEIKFESVTIHANPLASTM